MYQLRVDMSDFSDVSAHALYASAHVANSTEQFILTMGEFLGGDAGKEKHCGRRVMNCGPLIFVARVHCHIQFNIAKEIT